MAIRDVGIWSTQTTPVHISGNYVSGNYAVGIQYEASYNAQITNNTLVGERHRRRARPTTRRASLDAAIYISESGGDSQGGVELLRAARYQRQRPDRQLGRRRAVGELQTDLLGRLRRRVHLVDPSVYTEASCAGHISREKSPVDYYDNCRWKTQNVTRHEQHLAPSMPSAVGIRLHASPICAGSTACSPTTGRANTARPGPDHVQTEQPLLGQHLLRAVALLGLEPEQPGQPGRWAEWTAAGDRSVRDPRVRSPVAPARAASARTPAAH